MKLYVGNMAFSTTADSLRDAFSQFGDVQDVVIITDRETGRPRGFGFVTMSDDDARAAMNGLNGKEVDGRTLNVNEARERTDAPRGGGGGYRGGGGGGGGGGRGGRRDGGW
ncbi:MAG: RNA-binding protein [Phycisphaerales bacterium]|nr:RNA-binding protein [Phycisphaerales bacterium]